MRVRGRRAGGVEGVGDRPGFRRPSQPGSARPGGLHHQRGHRGGRLASPFEQLWVRQLGEAQFELCCIPFFVYDLALGDEVETEPARNRQYVLARVARSSGGYTFRAWFGDSDHPGAREELVDAVKAGGWLFEWYSENLLAIDAADAESAQQLADLLVERQRKGRLIYETGRTR